MAPEHGKSRQHERGFRWRNHEVTRIEGLSDAVFAFAVTLLVVSLEVPKTFNELAVIIRGFLPFGICFALLLQLWHEQYLYFRRYGLQNSTSTMLNCILLFLVLFYVYPLKFLFTLLLNVWTGGGARVRMPNGSWENMIEAHQLPELMAIFSGGYLAVAIVFFLLYGHALRQRHALGLSASEIFATRVSMGAAVINGSVALVSLLMALLGGPRLAGRSGMIYPVILCPGFTIYYAIMGAKSRRLTEAQAASGNPRE